MMLEIIFSKFTQTYTHLQHGFETLPYGFKAYNVNRSQQYYKNIKRLKSCVKVIIFVICICVFCLIIFGSVKSIMIILAIPNYVAHIIIAIA